MAPRWPATARRAKAERPWRSVAKRLAGHCEDDLPASMLILDDAVRAGGLGQRQEVADHRLQGAIGKERCQRPGAAAVVTDEHTVEGDVCVEHRVEAEFGGGDGGGLAA